MKQYLQALEYILANGKQRTDRTGVGTHGVFGYQMRFDLRKEFPAVTTKRLAWRSVVSELLWFLEGSTDERRLAEILYEKPRSELVDKTTIWTANADAQGKALGYTHHDLCKELGPIYGYQWRNFGGSSWIRDSCGGFDQIKWLVNEIKTNPSSRRLILSAWSAEQIELMALPPCHTLFQFYVQDGELSGQLYQRSCDMFLGVPFNLASYSLLIHMFAELTNLRVGDLVWTGGDCHIYLNHLDQVQEQISRTPVAGPTLSMPAFTTLDELIATKTSDYKLVGYNPMPSIKAPMAV